MSMTSGQQRFNKDSKERKEGGGGGGGLIPEIGMGWRVRKFLIHPPSLLSYALKLYFLV